MAHEIQIVTEAELRRLVRLDVTVVDLIEAAFAALARGGVVMPPILSMELPRRMAKSTSRPPISPASTVSRSRSARGSSTIPCWACLV